MTAKHIFLSKKFDLSGSGGGSNTFSGNMAFYCKKKKIPLAGHLLASDIAIVIAFHASLPMLWLAKKKGCFIIHRLDEHFVQNEDAGRKKRHEKIKQINVFADVTVFQSEFVKNNVLPHLNAKRWCVIHNGGNPDIFFDDGKERKSIGHVTNSVADKKRLDLLEETIRKYPHETFLLVGNHAQSKIDFARYPNVMLAGPVGRNEIAGYYRQMKCLYFPSENDPCPNTAVEAVLSGVPVCYNPLGGTIEIVKDCGLPLTQFDEVLKNHLELRKRCAGRKDLYFDQAAEQYLSLL